MRPRPFKARCIYSSLFEVRQKATLGLTDTERVVESGKLSYPYIDSDQQSFTTVAEIKIIISTRMVGSDGVVGFR